MAFLSVTQDLFSSRIVGWSIANHMEVNLCETALMMALNNRGFAKHGLHHSDRGSQYTSGTYQGLLTTNLLNCSMSGRGQCWDNAPAESFFGRLKEELFPRLQFETREQEAHLIEEYIGRYYNCRRIKKSLGFMTPIEYETAHAAAKTVAA